MNITIKAFDVRSVTEAELADYHGFTVASLALDDPDRPVPSYENFVGRLRNPESGFGESAHRAAYLDGRVVGVSSTRFPDDTNEHLVMAGVTVDPRLRRRGVGTALLRDLVAERRGRSVIEFWGVLQGGTGDAWLGHFGFRTVQAMQVQQLLVAEADPALWARGCPDGYRIAQWAGHCPDDLVGSYAAARGAIADAPTGALGYQTPRWTAERVRQVEQVLADTGVEQRVVVAVHERSDTVAAVTQMNLYPHRRDWAYQEDMAVLTGHRGHGLGVSVKSAMMRWLADVPELRRIITQTATGNAHMITVNRAIGYADVRVNLVCNQDVPVLVTALG